MAEEKYKFDIYTVELDGSNIVRLTFGSDDEIKQLLVWSPDGKRIAFSSTRYRQGGGDDVYVMDADGSNVNRVTHGSGDVDNWATSWSPDGRRIAFIPIAAATAMNMTFT